MSRTDGVVGQYVFPASREGKTLRGLLVQDTARMMFSTSKAVCGILLKLSRLSCLPALFAADCLNAAHAAIRRTYGDATKRGGGHPLL